MKGVLHLFRELKRFGGFFYRAAIDFAKKGNMRRNARYARYYSRISVQNNRILYESFMGRGMLCNPYALFNEMLLNPMYSNYIHIWVLDDLNTNTWIIEQYAKYRNVRFVKYLSRQYLKELCRAKYLINNVTFPFFFTKKESQIYINTWHGIPLKKLGYDMENGANITSNVIRNFLQVDYLISANPFLTDIYRYTYKLDGLFSGMIIEDGYPRLDTLVYHSKDEIIEKLGFIGVHIDKSKKTVLYAPTWRELDKDPQIVIEQYYAVKKQIESANPIYQVVIKVHQFVYQLLPKDTDIDYIIPATIDANEILLIADILISDYSSIYFDYLYFRRPILFYIPDLDTYAEYRGLYSSPEELPGPYSKNIEDIVRWLQNIQVIQDKYKEKIEQTRKWCCEYNVGKVSERILDIVFQGHEDGCKILRGLDCSKKKILIHHSRMRVNGVSSSCINLLSQIPSSEYDITLVITESKDAAEKALIESIPPNVRILMRKSSFNFTYASNVASRIVCAYGNQGIAKLVFPHKLYHSEVRRCFGQASFDAAIDFEGYNLTYAMIVASVPKAIHSIWLHSDMAAEQKLRFSYLSNIFSIYPLFDKIVSCSEAIMQVNRSNLATTETYSKFTFAKNMINICRIERGVCQAAEVEYRGRFYSYFTTEPFPGHLKVKMIPLDYDISNHIIVNGEDYIVQEESNQANGVTSVKLVSANSACKPIVRFITLGRLSPEKNHSALVRAFKRLISEYPNCILYLVGDGPLKKSTQELVKRIGLTNNVILTGNLENPFALMKQCHCFILPSLHEGQPMVIHEARQLKMPIIVSHFSSVEGALLPNGQLIIDTSVESIYQGMKAFLDGKVPSNYVFDAQKYNQEAYQEFLYAVGLDG